MNGIVTNWGAGTHAGLRRSVNEDSALVAPDLLVVADGLGGHRHGDLASAAVVRAFEPLAARPERTREEVEATIASAHSDVAGLGVGVPEGVGSTLAGLALVSGERGPEWLVFNVGDSRVYRHRRGLLEQFSVDHVATVSSEPGAPARSVLTRAVGMDAVLEPAWAADYRAAAVVVGDRWLVCSDGLTKELADGVIAAVLDVVADPQAAAETLIERALGSGGRDNITVAVLDVVADDGGGEPQEDTLIALRREPTR